MLAHKKLWEAGITLDSFWNQVAWFCDDITTRAEFDIMNKYNQESEAETEPEREIEGMYALFFALYFADNDWRSEPTNQHYTADDFILV